MQGKVRAPFLFLPIQHSSSRVLLHLGTTVWVERVQLMVRQPSIASYVAKFDSDQDLVNEGKTNSQVMDTLHCQSRTKVKVVEWC